MQAVPRKVLTGETQSVRTGIWIKYIINIQLEKQENVFFSAFFHMMK